MKYKKHIILTLSGILLIFSLLILNSPKFKDWIKFEIVHRDYCVWKRHGGPLKDGFTTLFNIDRNKNSMVNGLTYEEIIGKYPFLVKSDIYDEESYKGSFAHYLKKENKDVKILWFHNGDDFDWCILVFKDKSLNCLKVVKG